MLDGSLYAGRSRADMIDSPYANNAPLRQVIEERGIPVFGRVTEND